MLTRLPDEKPKPIEGEVLPPVGTINQIDAYDSARMEHEKEKVKKYNYRRIAIEFSLTFVVLAVGIALYFIGY